MKHLNVALLMVCVLVFPALAACAPDPTPVVGTAEPVETAPFTLTSSAFAEGGQIPVEYTYSFNTQCAGENLSPPLAWTGTPAGTQSFVLTLIDPDGANWVHWVQYDIPADVTGLPETAAGPEIGVRGLNHFGELGYAGPCPPGDSHRYVFTLYALDTVLSLAPGASNGQLTIAMNGHILAEAKLTGMRGR